MLAIRLSSCIAAFSSITLAGLAAAGCSSSTSSTPAAGAGTSGPSAVATGSPSPAGITAKLLTAADLPKGWSADVTPSDAPANTMCPMLNTPLWNSGLPNRGEADLSHGLGGPYLVEQIAAGSPAQADKAWQLLAAGIPRCTTYTHTGSAGASTFNIAPTTKLPSFGDASYAFTLGITITGGVNASGYVVSVRSGNSIVMVYLEGLTGVDKPLVEQIVTAAVTKGRT